MKTILQALKDEIGYPLSSGLIENKLMKRGIEGEGEISAEILSSDEFVGAYADCLYSLIESPNSFSESDISFSLSDKNLILKKVNNIYKSLGEPEVKLDQPNVYIGSK